MHRSLIAFALLLAVAQSSGAVTISTSVSVGPASNPTTDAGGPANSGEVSAAAVIPLQFRDLAAHSALDAEGNAAVALDGLYSSSNKAHLAGIEFPEFTDAVTTWTSTLTNNDAVSKPYVYSFVLSPFRLSSYDNFIGADDPLANIASFAVEVRADGNLVFQSSALLRGATQDHVLIETGVDLGGVFGSNEFAGFYDFSQYDARLPLGSVAPGGTITIETKLIAHTEAKFDGSGGFVDMGDPLDLKGVPGMYSTYFGVDDTVGAAPVTWSATKALYR